ADADQLDFSLELGIFFQLAKHLVDSGSLPLTVRSVHAENLDDDHLGLDIRDRKNGLLIQSEVLSVMKCLGNRQLKVRQDPAFRRRLVGGGYPAGKRQQQQKHQDQMAIFPAHHTDFLSNIALITEKSYFWT
ncbi:MAG: hypothetical protein ABF292_04645, partial [Desulfobacterales bacterium]